jgi:broad specificity phosphatase PhoE
MAIDLTATGKEAADLMNALDTAANTYNDDDWNNQAKIEETAIDVDGAIVALILETEGHGRREAFKSTVSVAHGAMVPTHLGDISVAISSKAASRCKSVQYIERLRANNAGFTTIRAKYVLDENNVLWHTGIGNASVTLFNYTRGVVLQAPDEYKPAIVCGIVAIRMGKDGEKTGAAGYYNSLYQNYLAMISQGAKSLPPVEPYQGGQG